MEEAIAEYNPGIPVDSLIDHFLSGFETDFATPCKDFGDKVAAGKADKKDFAAIILRSLCYDQLVQQSGRYQRPLDVEIAQLVRKDVSGLDYCFPVGLSFDYLFKGEHPFNACLTNTVKIFMDRIFRRTFGYDFAFYKF